MSFHNKLCILFRPTIKSTVVFLFRSHCITAQTRVHFCFYVQSCLLIFYSQIKIIQCLSLLYFIPVLWIRNDLFWIRIRLHICLSSRSFPCLSSKFGNDKKNTLSTNYLHCRPETSGLKVKNTFLIYCSFILAGSGTNNYVSVSRKKFRI